MHGIIEKLREKTNISSDDVFIVLSENKEENWSFGRGQAQLVE
ncbi:MAG: tautomerase family protein [Deltaproteobacteria bacterium]|nr:tautomerase family protein [Deltaproteobacteria bacterium]